VGWLVGTRNGLQGQDGRWLEGREITALAPDVDGWWVLADGRDVIRLRDGAAETVASVDEETARCVLPFDGGALVGTANARLSLVGAGSAAEMLASFDDADGRDGWYTPWGGPPDTRSLTSGPGGLLFANVHVGGILRATDPRGTWEPTIDVDADVHQVVADPGTAGHVVAATAFGLAESFDDGDTWRSSTDGLHAPYARAVALDGDLVFMSASTGPRGGRAAVYRREAGANAFERCEGGLPEWFAGNIDSHRLAAGGGTVVFGTDDGLVFTSGDGGEAWETSAEGVGHVTCASLDPSGPTGT
jgi:hypothetical protein